MKNISVYDIKGKASAKISLDQNYFDGRINRPLLHQAALMYLANNRRGSAATKTRGEVRGGGRKPWRQKGTGRARFGSIRNPIWRGGGVVFGPHPKKYRYDLPKKLKDLALQQSLNGKLPKDDLIVVEQFPLGDGYKTKTFAAFLKNLKAEEKPLVVTESYDQGIIRTARNIAGVTIKAFNNVNAFDVLKHKKVIFSKQSLENLIKMRKK